MLLQLELDLFEPEYREPAHFAVYWRERLANWPGDVFYWRHARDTTGWSIACGGFFFARCLFSRGLIDRDEFKRWAWFNRRVRRWDRRVG